VLAAYRSEQGLVGIASRWSRRAIVTRKSDGKVQEYIYHGLADIGSGGEAVFVTLTVDGRLMIAVQRFGETRPRIVTDGPWDTSPSINPDGRTFLYAANSAHDVYRCPMDATESGGCRLVHTDLLGHASARMSPNGRLLAYNVADAAGWRLRVLPLDGGPMRDLGLLSSGRILWASDTRLWQCELDAKKWSEVDVASERFTGRTVWRPDSDWVCDDPPPGVGDLENFEVRKETDVTTEVHLVRGM